MVVNNSKIPESIGCPRIRAPSQRSSLCRNITGNWLNDRTTAKASQLSRLRLHIRPPEIPDKYRDAV